MNIELRPVSEQPTHSQCSLSSISNKDKLHEFLLNHADFQLKKIGPMALWIGTIFLIPLNIRRISDGDWLGITLSIVSLCLGWFIVKSTRLSSHARIGIFICVCFLVGAANLLTHGLMENGRVMLFYACIGVTSLNSRRYSLLMLLASSTAIFTTGILLQRGLLASSLVTEHPALSQGEILSFTLYFAIFAGVSQLSIHEIFRKLISTWEQQNSSQVELRRQNNLIQTLAEQRAIELEELKKSKQELDHYKSDLEKMVAQRTVELNIERDRANAANKAKTAFMTNMSHELRTPLNTIIGYSQLLNEEINEIDTGEKDLADDISRIEKSGQHLLNLINTLLDISKIEADKMLPNVASVSLNTLLEEVEIYARPLAHKNQNYFKINSYMGAVQLHTDAQKVKQILLNLIGNAFKFTRGGEVKLEISSFQFEHRAGIKFDVVDNGPGISADFLNALFEPFSQEHFSLARTTTGSGLGLAISKGYAQLLGGNIVVESDAGKGSTFSLILPLNFED
ncbi:MAG: HAMP domain-containing sensor histidine kinase [Chloroflexota bacterium]